MPGLIADTSEFTKYHWWAQVQVLNDQSTSFHILQFPDVDSHGYPIEMVCILIGR